MRFEGRQLGRYSILHLIGRGGVGAVYLANDRHIKREVALKIIQSEELSTEDAQDATRLFQREAQTIAMLNHPNILQLFDFGEENVEGAPVAYLVTPFCPDGSLSTWLRKHKRSTMLTPQELIPFMQQAADALAYAHEKGIVHRDVKPSNFLVRSRKVTPEQPDLMLADFGIARIADGITRLSQTIRGTPSYMSPEQWNGNASSQSDQYALAIMAYELLTGRLPFQGTQQQVMYQHNMIMPQPLSCINPRLTSAIDRVVLRALAKEPGTRFPSVIDFARALQQAIQSEVSTPKVQFSGTSTIAPSAFKPEAPMSPPGPVIPPVKVQDTPYTPLPPTIIANDMRTTLRISGTDAINGVLRSLQLPNGQRINVQIPPAAYDGQEIYLESLVEPSSPKAPKKNLIVQLDVVPSVEEPVVVPLTGAQSTPWPLKTVLTVVLVLAVIIASIIGLFSFGTTFFANNAEHATVIASDATMHALDATSAAVAATSNVQVTSTARANATATVVYNPYDVSLKTLALYESLEQNTASRWDERKGACTFAVDGYHVINTGQTAPAQACIANHSDVTNASFEAEMTLLKGSGGGLLLSTANATSYYFHISTDRNYMVQTCTRGSCKTIMNGYSSYIIPGQKQMNLLALSITNDSLSVYINKYYINDASISVAPHSHLGLVAETNGEVVFRNVKVWTA